MVIVVIYAMVLCMVALNVVCGGSAIAHIFTVHRFRVVVLDRTYVCVRYYSHPKPIAESSDVNLI